MFGQSNAFGSGGGGFGQNTTPAFGSPAPAPGGLFGSPAPAPAFGTPAPAPAFGSAFGAPAPGGLFGNPAPAPTGFGAPGGFGSPSPAPFGAPPAGGSMFGGNPSAAPSFGSPSPGLFGAPAASSTPFGQSNTTPAFGAPSTSTFGATGGFGTSFGAPAPSGGIFGAPAPSFGAPAPSPFGAPAPAFGAPAPSFGAPAPAFGAPAPTFGAPAPAFGAPAPSPFGAPAPAFGAPSPSPFGAPAPAFGAPAPSPFGAPAPAFGGGFGSQPAPATGGLFGAPAPSPTGGLFGAPPAAASSQTGGTRMAPYAVTNRQDGQTAMNLLSITAMPQYENKSFEELRSEDYSQGNRGQSNPSGGGVGGFGSPSPAPSTGLFGAPAPAPFGAPAPAPGGFGAPAPAPFGSPTPAPFGAPAPSTFGAPAPAPGSFGSSGFGSSSFGSSGFGSSTPAPSPGFFGSTPAPAPFGSPAPAPFGAPSPAPGGFFGSPAPAPFGSTGGGLFGSTPAPAPFGTPAPAGGALFGSAPGPAPFGAPPSTGLFGAPAPASGGIGFGAKPPDTGFFGGSTPAPGGFGAFGASSQSGPTMVHQHTVPANAYIVPQASNEVLAQQVRALINERKELEKFDVWKGKSPSGGTLTTPTNQAESASLSRPAYVPHIASTPTSGVKIRPRGFFADDAKSKTPAITPMGRDDRAIMSPESFARSSALTLVVRPESDKKLTQRRPLRLNTSFQSPTTGINEDIQLAPDDDTTAPSPSSSLRVTAAPAFTKPSTPSPDPPRRDPGEEYYNKLIGAESQQFSPTVTSNKPVSSDSGLLPKLTKAGYDVSPSIEDMARMSEAELATVAGFSVKRFGVGMVEWEGAVDIRGADLDSIVSIEPRSVEVYSIEEEKGVKPTVGSKLNRPAIITCYNVFPQAGPGASEEEKNRYAEKVAKNTKKIGAELIDYDKKAGTWKIRVRHFSRYALVDDDSDNEGAISGNEPVQLKRDLDPKPMPLASKQTRITLQDLNSSSHFEDATMVSDIENMVESIADRYKMEADMVSREIELRSASEKTKAAGRLTAITFEDEGDNTSDEFVPAFSSPDTSTILQSAQISGSICKRIALKTTVSSSSIDMGLKMNSSFRVGWLPDGSFLQLKPGSVSPVVVKRRPEIGTSHQMSSAAETLSNHVVHTAAPNLDEEAPLFSLPGREEATPKLLEAIQSLAASPSIHADVAHGLRMLSSLLFFHSDSEGVADRQVTAAHDFMIRLCERDVEIDISHGKMKQDPIESIFAALSGGDLDRSCSLAGDAGCTSLLVALTVNSMERREFNRQYALLADQGCATKLDLSSVRVIKALGLASDYEDILYSQNKSTLDWRRRLAIRLWQSKGNTLKEVIEAYEHGLSLKKLPFPHPPYKRTTHSVLPQDMLYKLLKMCVGLEDEVCEIISPAGFSQNLLDYSHSFYLACAVCSAYSAAKFTNYHAERLVDGYVSQLIANGQWVWAVFISLCAISELTPAQQMIKRYRTKEIVLRHFDGIDNYLQDFLLKKVGIPSSWISEALAVRGLCKHDLSQLIGSTIEFDRKTGRILVEEFYLPELFFRNDPEEILKAQKFIEETAHGEVDTLAATMHKFFGLEMQLSDSQVVRNPSQLQHLLVSLSTVETALRVYHKMLGSSAVCRVLFPRAPTARNVSAMISTALETLDQRRLEIECTRRSMEL